MSVFKEPLNQSSSLCDADSSPRVGAKGLCRLEGGAINCDLWLVVFGNDWKMIDFGAGVDYNQK